MSQTWTRILLVYEDEQQERALVPIMVAGIVAGFRVHVHAVRCLSVMEGRLTHWLGDARQDLAPKNLKRATLITVARSDLRAVRHKLELRKVPITSVIEVATKLVDKRSTLDPQAGTR